MAADNTGLFLSTTMMIPDDNEEMKVRLYQYLNSIALATNLKDTASYSLEEFLNGQVFFPDPTIAPGDSNYLIKRGVYRKVIDFGQLPNTATKSVAHDIAITNTFSFTRIYATASNPVGLLYFPIPTTGVTITVDAANVNITTGSNLTAYTKCYVILEFLKF